MIGGDITMNLQVYVVCYTHKVDKNTHPVVDKEQRVLSGVMQVSSANLVYGYYCHLEQ